MTRPTIHHDQKITPCLFYNGTAEAAANYYVTLLPDSQVDNIVLAPSDNPSGAEGTVLLVEFTLAGMKFVGLNGGPQFPFTEAVSFQIRTDDQAETDRLWEAVIADGGEESQCGWCKDRWGMNWQIVPNQLLDLVCDRDSGRAGRAFQAMLGMGKIDIATLLAAAENA